MEHNAFSLSYLGECYVRLELAKRGYKVISTVPGFFFDLLGHDGKKIEVKTATKSLSKKNKNGENYDYVVWKFRLSLEQQKQHPDFYVCVLMEDLEQAPISYFIFPKGSQEVYTESNKSGILFIYESDLKGLLTKENKLNRYQYLNRWDLIASLS